MNEVIIVGSGIAGTAAAYALAKKNIKPLVIDVGESAPNADGINENFYDYAERRDTFDLMIGKAYQGLANVHHPEDTIPAKLTAPNIGYVTARNDLIPKVTACNYSAIQSYALGGLANAWGAGLYRYTDRDLRDFPFHADELQPFYDTLEEEIGISGQNDDLTSYFGRIDTLQSPLDLSINADYLLKQYVKKRRSLHKIGFHMGRPHLGVLSQEKDERKPCDYNNLEFWQASLPHIYSPAMTLEKLIHSRRIDYLSQNCVKSWSREKDHIVLNMISLGTRKMQQLQCRKLILAAGAINSAQIALASRQDYATVLTLLDNPALQFPFILPARIGSALQRRAFGLTQLNCVIDEGEAEELIQGSILEVTSPARAEFFSRFPLAASANLTLLQYLLPAVLVLQLFFPCQTADGSRFSLESGGSVKIAGQEYAFDQKLISKVLRIFCRMKALSSSLLIVKVKPGQGIHYAGTLPMRQSPGKLYECSREGELYDEPNVYVADGGCFPHLPAKNLSFTVMANAMRIADGIGKKIIR